MGRGWHATRFFIFAGVRKCGCTPPSPTVHPPKGAHTLRQAMYPVGYEPKDQRMAVVSRTAACRQNMQTFIHVQGAQKEGRHREVCEQWAWRWGETQQNCVQLGTQTAHRHCRMCQRYSYVDGTAHRAIPAFRGSRGRKADAGCQNVAILGLCYQSKSANCVRGDII